MIISDFLLLTLWELMPDPVVVCCVLPVSTTETSNKYFVQILTWIMLPRFDIAPIYIAISLFQW